MNDSVALTSVHLRVSDLARSVDFYTRQLGFVATASAVVAGAAHTSLAVTADAPPLLELTEDRAAPPSPRDAAGLFHAALLFPSRAALGAWLTRAAAAQVEFDGFSDHGVSEAIYFSDPDGNGLEFYADRPRSAWPMRDGALAMMTAPLNVHDLLAAGAATNGHAIEPVDAKPPATATPLAGARWGHLHLRISDLDRAENFYTTALGLSLMQRYGTGARFLAADGYHHHLGLNTWGGIRRPQPVGALGLVEVTFSTAPTRSPQTARDPDGIALRSLPR